MIIISCLPLAGGENPYQKLMINGLRENDDLKIIEGNNNRFIGILLTWLIHKPNYIHFDWISRFYLRKNLFLTVLFLPLFLLQITFIKTLTKTKIVWTIHNILPHDSNHNRLNIWVRKFFISNCLWIRVFANSTKDKVIKTFKINDDKIKVVPSGDYTSVYENNISKNESKKILNLENENVVFTYLGFIRPYKGIEELINEFSNIVDDSITLIIAGKPHDEKYAKHIQEIASDKRIRLDFRFIEENILQVYFNATDVVILPFKQIENSGSVIMAMGFKKLIIVPKLGVISEMLSHQGEFVYDTNSSLQEKIELAIKIGSIKIKKYGEMNYQKLKSYKWSDFSVHFK